jgi:hypothetical protein
MTEAPRERTGMTEMVFAGIKARMGAFLLRGTSAPMSLDGFRRSDMSLHAKDKIIDKLQDALEEEFLRYCDPIQPLHFVSSIICRVAICKLRLAVHTPFQYSDRGMNVPQSESDIIFNNGMKVIEYANLLHSSRILRGYRWFKS